MRPIILIGGGGHCKSVIDAALGSGRRIAGIIDVPEAVGQCVLGIPVIGTDDDIAKYADDHEFIVTVGFIADCSVRRRLVAKVAAVGGRFATVFAADAYVSPFASIGDGTVVLHKALVNADARIGMNCIVNTGAIIEHDVVVLDLCHISTGARINGGCKLGQEVFVGSGSVVNQCTDICNGAIIASSSLVNRHIAEPGIYAGVPVHKIEKK